MFDPTLLGSEHVRPLRRDEYEQLVKLGAFEAERIELLRGVLVEMSPQGEPHARISAWIHAWLVRALHHERFEVRSHTSFAATDDSVPEPDVAVFPLAMRARLPRKALLLVEVAETSLAKDRMIKPEIYARAGVPEYWIVDVVAREVEVLSAPELSGYRQRKTLAIGDVLRPIKLGGIALPVADLPWSHVRSPRSPRSPRSGR
ncbi:MAG: Uma2 family endonuclease [Myxococcales bacterium]|nr:Uma2 family endonuclease [Myxococcales bacterium]